MGSFFYFIVFKIEYKNIQSNLYKIISFTYNREYTYKFKLRYN